MNIDTFDTAVENNPVEEPASDTADEQTEATVLTVAAEGIKEGASDARAAAARLIPAVKHAVSVGVYRTFYGISYGAVYSAMVVAHAVPTNNIMGEGLRRGAESARNAFRKRHEEQTVAGEAVSVDELDDTLVAA